MRILLLNQNHIGDALFTTPAIAALRAGLPGAHIVNAAVSGVVPLFAGNPHISEHWVRPAERWQDFLRFMLRIRRARFDAVISFSASSTQFGVFAWCSGAGIRIGSDQPAIRRFLTHRVPWHNPHRHHVLRHLDQVSELVPVTGDFPMELHLNPQWQEEARGALDALSLPPGRPVIGLNPGATVVGNRWPVARWRSLADALVEGGLAPVMFGGPDDASLVREIRESCRHPIPSTQGRLSLGGLAAAIATCSAFVSGDTGPLHVAAAVGTPVVALFGLADPESTGPYSRRAIVIYHPETDHGSDVHGRVETITVSEVTEAVADLLDSASARAIPTRTG